MLGLDFDGVLHAHTSRWGGASYIPDGPVEGAFDFLASAIGPFRVAVHSGRAAHDGGVDAMKSWLFRHLTESGRSEEEVDRICDRVEWWVAKPPATIMLDDRAITFDGTWPELAELAAFKPWYKRGAT